jgi:hypothetical protein
MSFVRSTYFSDRFSAVQQTKLTAQRNISQDKNITSGRIGGGVFASARSKKRTGWSAKACLQ